MNGNCYEEHNNNSNNKTKHTTYTQIVQFTSLLIVKNKSTDNILHNTKAGLALPSVPCPELLPSFPNPKAEPAYHSIIRSTLTT